MELMSKKTDTNPEVRKFSKMTEKPKANEVDEIHDAPTMILNFWPRRFNMAGPNNRDSHCENLLYWHPRWRETAPSASCDRECALACLLDTETNGNFLQAGVSLCDVREVASRQLPDFLRRNPEDCAADAEVTDEALF